MIDWFTVSAQIINFLLLVLLLKKFLYGPIIRAMAKREETIAGRLNEAAQKREEARSEIERYKKKNADFESQREEMLTDAKAAAEEEKKNLVAAARKEVDAIKARWNESIRQERDAFFVHLRNSMADEIYSVARKVFSDLADMSFEEHMTDVFIRKLNGLDQDERNTIKTKLEDAGNGLTVATSFDIPQQKLSEVREAIKKVTGRDSAPEFALSKDILCGIELRARGYTLGWNVDAYLKSLEEEFGKVLGS